MSKNYFFPLILVIFTFPVSLQAQYENVWVFGTKTPGKKGAGLDFNSGSPVPIRSEMISREGNASVCNPKGQLLFYTEGDTVWSSNGTKMPNGIGLTGLPSSVLLPNGTNFATPPTSSTAQGALIVPMPNDEDKYYVFSLSNFVEYKTAKTFAPLTPEYFGRLYYSVVDMRLNGGMGDIVPGQKGILVDSNLTESMTGVAGDNCNIWVMVSGPAKNTGEGNLLKAFEITDLGVNVVPVVSYLAGMYTNVPIGKINIAPNGKKLAITRGGQNSTDNLVLCDFNASTGSVTNPISLDTTSGGDYYGVCFSHDNSKLYVNDNKNGIGDIIQYDLSSNNKAVIINSEIIVTKRARFTDIKRGPNGKIYYIHGGNSDLTRPYLGAINYPNLAGVACQVDSNAVKLLDSLVDYAGFPNVVPLIAVDTASQLDSIIFCSKGVQDNLTLYASLPSFRFQWEDGSTDSSRVINQPGTYWVKNYNYCQFKVDSFYITFSSVDPVITVDHFDLSTTLTYSTYQWYLNGTIIRGATSKIYTVTENGDYVVVVSNENGCVDTSDIYPVTNVTGINKMADLVQSIKVYPNPVKSRLYISAPFKINVKVTGLEGKLIKEVSQASSFAVQELAAGIYLLHITDEVGRLLKIEKFVKEK